ncbi:MAG TPA: hypothetical protein VI958_05825 [Acidobacteriota bacterium]
MTFALIIGIVVVFFVLRARIAALQQQMEKLTAKVDDLRRSRYFAEKQTPIVKSAPAQLNETIEPAPATSGAISAAPLGAVVSAPSVAAFVDNEEVKSPEAVFLADAVAAATDFPKIPVQPLSEGAEEIMKIWHNRFF